MIEEAVLIRLIKENKDKKVSGCIRQMLVYQTNERRIVCPGCLYRYYCRRNFKKVIK